jgi:hypothetical protein
MPAIGIPASGVAFGRSPPQAATSRQAAVRLTLGKDINSPFSGCRVGERYDRTLPTIVN